MGKMFKEVFQYIAQQVGLLPDFWQCIAWVGLICLFFVGLYLLFSLIFAPIMYLYNRLTDRNQNNSLAQSEYLLGQLTVKIQGDSVGEVMETGSGHARATFPAKLFKADEIANDHLLPVGTSVIIIEFDANGIALVVENKNK